MHVLVFNAGSSSLKCSVFDTALDRQLFKLDLDRLDSIEAGVRQVPALLAAQGIAGIDAVGHRVVHGGNRFHDACVIDDKVLDAIAACADLAPLHHPPALAGIRIARECWPALPQVAVFDTAFHHTIPERAFTYAVPEAWRATGLRRYGFHGTSHKYVMQHVAAALQAAPQDLRIVSCHLGNGASVCAIERGVSVDTSMGMTTLEGLVMGTRSGDVDPGLFAHLQRTLGLDVAEIEDTLYRRSGLAALSGAGNDMRDIEQRAAAGDRRAQLAIQVYAYRVHKYIGAYAAVMGGVDAIAFTGGIGENSAPMRKRICERFDFLGLAFDDDANAGVRLAGDEVVLLHQAHSRVKVLVTATREQWMIARESERVLAAASSAPAGTRTVPIAVSARHVHLTEAACAALFGAGHELHVHKPLSQPGQWAAQETVDVVGPRGELHGLRVLGPCRAANQIEISETDAFVLGVDAPLRLSGHTGNTPLVTLRGPAGSLRSNGVIVAQRHIHARPDDAAALGLTDGEQVDVEVHSEGRSLVFRDVAVRVGAEFATEMHLDTDEANAAHIEHGGRGVLMPAEGASARIQRGPRLPAPTGAA
ncbi:acetate/propionate family kinase [Methylibium sp.]|uniref:acetate/propionate family kinase n=1 Tax=Methylibium sp. TaxID=2067992 RepID=UPI003D0FF24E